MSQSLLAFQNILQNSNIFNKCRETVLVMPFGDEKVTQFSGFPPTSVSYLKVFQITWLQADEGSSLIEVRLYSF